MIGPDRFARFTAEAAVPEQVMPTEATVQEMVAVVPVRVPVQVSE